MPSLGESPLSTRFYPQKRSAQVQGLKSRIPSGSIASPGKEVAHPECLHQSLDQTPRLVDGSHCYNWRPSGGDKKNR